MDSIDFILEHGDNTFFHLHKNLPYRVDAPIGINDISQLLAFAHSGVEEESGHVGRGDECLL